MGNLCANITRLQRAEIAFLSEWLLARKHKVSASCEKCHMNHKHTQPPAPCEDLLSVSSFCHVLGGDLNCACSTTKSSHSCGSIVKIDGFGSFNVSAECARSCGLCPQRPPL